MPSSLRIVMLGTGTFAEPVFAALLTQPRHAVVGLVTQPDREVGALRGSTRQVGKGMKTIADEAGVPVIQPESINTPEGVAQIKAWDADLLVTAAYGQILKADVLNAARLGGINVHGSLLPKYRGAAPVAWAIWRGESETGVTIIRMTTGLDAGAMLAKEATPIGATETAGDVEARLATIGARLAVQVIDQLADGPLVGEPQDPAYVTKAPKLTKESGAIDWNKSAVEIERQIRALQPWPTAYTNLHRVGQSPQRVILFQSAATTGEAKTPGTAWPSADGKAIEVATGDGVLRILELQLAGKKRLSARDFLNGRLFRPGDRMGMV
jgi:methionyl-tRNA formyltransferase